LGADVFESTGCGKTTVCAALLKTLASSPYNLRVAAFSLDDLYLPHDGLVAVREANPGNKLLAGRGLPGTHDVSLGRKILEGLKTINARDEGTVRLPIFDKSLFGGEGDRSKEAVKVEAPLDLVLFEGWSVGFSPLDEQELESRYQTAEQASHDSARTAAPAFLAHSLGDLKTVNTLLRHTASQLWGFFTVFIQLEVESLSQIYHWRLQQEHAMKSQNGGTGMTDEQVRVFVDRYLPGYELWMEGIKAGTYAQQWKGRGLSLVYGAGREVLQARHF
jgi:D-glycerate 3-kinase